MAVADGRPGAIPDTVEIVVLGAGVAGLATALRLAQAGREVLVIDQSEPWREGSAVNAGTLALQNKEPGMLAFYKEALEEWARLKDELGTTIDHVRQGGLRVASSEAGRAALHDSAAEQGRLGVETEWLEGNRLRARAPWLGPNVVCATFCAADGYASPLLAGRALIRAVVAAGGRVASHVKLLAQTERSAGFRLATSAGAIDCRTVVIACGAWSTSVARLFGIDVPIESRVNMLTVTERIAPFMDNRLVTHINGRLTLKQFPNGSCVLGGGARGDGGIVSGRKDLDFDRLQQNWRLHVEVVPHLKTANVVRSWAGFEGITPDTFPVIGRAPGRDGVYLAVAAEAGFTGGPIIGRLVSEMIVAGAARPLADMFRLERFLQ